MQSVRLDIRPTSAIYAEYWGWYLGFVRVAWIPVHLNQAPPAQAALADLEEPCRVFSLKVDGGDSQGAMSQGHGRYCRRG